MKAYLGVDVGSVSTDIALIDEDGEVIDSVYLRTQGQPIKAVQEGMKQIGERIGKNVTICGAGTTGSGRQLAGLIVGADIIKNEITAHAVAATHIVPDVQTILEIGGQDSKIIILRKGIVTDFAMNTVCAAGTGSFLDQQAYRLDIPIEEFGDIALKSTTAVRIAGRCTVFAESDMIHKQQLGYSIADIINGLCEALVRNYLNNIGKGKEILEPILFQGGVAANKGIKAAFERALGKKVIVPKYHGVMGAIGSALLAKEAVEKKGSTDFKGFEVSEMKFETNGFDCDGCANMCEVVEFIQSGIVLARWGDKCNKWTNSIYDKGNTLKRA
ncbi:MAG: acyl-CoA dehydratase activase [Thermoanaerobacteraceae bacterium]|nr:acyl-CoA dehydratase activase [Thermoanaerobacteraceae bacterium]